MCVLAIAILFAPTAVAQFGVGWSLVADGEPFEWAPSERYEQSESSQAAAEALQHLQQSGFVLARIDSLVQREGGNVFFATRGPAATIGQVSVSGVDALGGIENVESLELQSGRSFSVGDLENDINYLLTLFEQRGWALAQVTPAIELNGLVDGIPVVDIQLEAEPGERLRLLGVELDGARRTSDSFAARAANLRVGEMFETYDPVSVRRNLEATGLFESVGVPTIALADSGAVLRMAVEEAPPGKFDLILGYLPGSGARSGSFVGNGLLELTNLFGGGRQIRLRLVRNPGLVSSVDAQLSDPYILGLPLRATARFEGLNQDSTFSRQRYSLEGGYRVAQGLELIVSASREQVDPGPFGAELIDGRPRVSESNAVFAGAGVRFRHVDHTLNPRRGLILEAIVEQGFRRRSLSASDGDVVTEPTNVQQQRMEVGARLFVPTFRRQALVIGTDAHILLSGRAAGGEENSRFDRGDLFRFGGATSLRGYDEDQFIGRIVGRAIAEYRYQLDRTSFAFLFTDIGYVDRPEIADFEAEKDIKSGYGFGIQYSTPLGLVTVTYALNPDVGVGQGKVHAGLSFGL